MQEEGARTRTFARLFRQLTLQLVGYKRTVVKAHTGEQAATPYKKGMNRHLLMSEERKKKTQKLD